MLRLREPVSLNNQRVRTRVKAGEVARVIGTIVVHCVIVCVTVIAGIAVGCVDGI